MQTERHSVVPAVFIVVTDSDRALLHRRQNTGFHDGEYDVPSGHIEEGEVPPVAAARELTEESGLIADTNLLELFHVITSDETPDMSYLYFFFRVALGDCEGEYSIQEPNKCDDMQLFSLSDLPDVVEHVKTALGHISCESVTFSKIEIRG